MQTKAEIEKWYFKEDPWGYRSNPDDLKRKEIILSVIAKYAPAGVSFRRLPAYRAKTAVRTALVQGKPLVLLCPPSALSPSRHEYVPSITPR